MTKNLMSETLHQLMHTYINLLHQGIKRQKLELTVTQIRTLKSVRYNPHSTAKSIAERIQRDKAQITRALNDLVEANLIIKTDNSNSAPHHWQIFLIRMLLVAIFFTVFELHLSLFLSF